jgi:hypothetical protein
VSSQFVELVSLRSQLRTYLGEMLVEVVFESCDRDVVQALGGSVAFFHSLPGRPEECLICNGMICGLILDHSVEVFAACGEGRMQAAFSTALLEQYDE